MLFSTQVSDKVVNRFNPPSPSLSVPSAPASQRCALRLANLLGHRELGGIGV